MIDRYLERGDLFGMEDELQKGSVLAAVTVENDDTVELKNLAVLEDEQRKGYGRQMIEYVCAHYSEKYRTLFVGTGAANTTLRFYEHCGFSYSHRIKDFFTQNYDHPIYEDGVLLKDMIYLRRETAYSKIKSSSRIRTRNSPQRTCSNKIPTDKS